MVLFGAVELTVELPVELVELTFDEVFEVMLVVVEMF
jgi:hypothetical protein